MGLGDFYERMLRMPARRARKPVRRPGVTPRRRAVNAVMIVGASILAVRGMLDIAITGGDALTWAGVLAAAPAAWLVALWHLASAGRRRTGATVLGVSLLVCLGCTAALHWWTTGLDAVSLVGLRRGTFGSLSVAGMAAVAVAMLGLSPVPNEDADQR